MEDQKSPDEFARLMIERKRDPSKVAARRPDDFASRTLGVIALLLASFSFLLYTYEPLTQALARSSSIDYNAKFIFAQPVLLLMGLVYTVFGPKASTVLGPTTKPSKWGWLFYLACFALSMVYLSVIRERLRSLGYQI